MIDRATPGIHHDGGGKLSGARRPLYGADAVARFFIGITKKGLRACLWGRQPSTASLA